jgi:RluA family pseudouridine synthase
VGDGRESPRRWAQHRVTAEEAGRTVEQILTGVMGISGRMIQRLTRSEGVQLNRRPAFLGRAVRSGDVVSARVSSDEEAGLPPVEMPLAIAHEDADLLVIDKPAFLLVHPTAPEHDRTLAHGVAHHFAALGLQAKVRPVHRIDRDTSGLVLFAKSAFAHQHLDRQLREGGVRREYLALVRGAVAGDEGVVDAPIGRDRRNPNLRVVRPDGEPAVTRWRVTERFPAATLLALELETGRTHQIRVHLGHLGHPVLGDRQYGRAGLRLMPRQGLHAWRLAFTQPTSGEPVALEAPLPDDMAAAAEALRGGARTS